MKMKVEKGVAKLRCCKTRVASLERVVAFFFLCPTTPTRKQAYGCCCLAIDHLYATNSINSQPPSN